jgi:hypothetical protein
VENNAEFQDCHTDDLGQHGVLEAMIVVIWGLKIVGT